MSPAESWYGARLAGLTVLVAVVMFIDGYDLQVMALLMAPLSSAWGIPVPEFGVVQSAAAAGLGLGSAFVAPLGDRFGRRRLVLGGFAFLTLTVLGSGFADSIPVLAAWRLLTGAALGVTLVNAVALLAEHAPRARRALLLTGVGIGIPLGAMASGFIAPPVLKHFGWPFAFWFSAAVGAVIWVVMWRWLPESAALRGPADSTSGAVTSRFSFASVFQGGYRVGTLAIWALFAGNAFLIYILVSWIPALASQNGWAMEAASHTIVWFQAGGLAGGLMIAAAMDRWNPFLALLAAYAVAAICMAGFGAVPEAPLAWGALFALVGAAISGVHLTLNAIGAMLYPPAMLATGLGFTVAVARLGAVSAPLIGAMLVARELPVGSFMRLQLLPLALCVAAVLVLRRRTAQ